MKTNIFDKIKENIALVMLIAFAIVALAVILIATLAMHEFVVPVCILVIIETLIATLLRKSELWLHGVAVIVQLLVGFIIGRFPLMALCVVIYVAATVALMFIHRNGNEKIAAKTDDNEKQEDNEMQEDKVQTEEV